MVQIRPTETDRDRHTAQYRNWQADAIPGADTAAAAVDAGDGDHDADPTDAYVDLVQKDNVVCDTCFAYRYDALTVEWWRGSFGWSQYQTWTARREHAVAVPADDSPAQGMRLACAHCGTRADVKHRPIPSAKLDGYVANISDTLALKGIGHAPRVLHTVARRRNTSANQGRQDSHVFVPAVAAAIRHAGRGLTRGSHTADADADADARSHEVGGNA